MCWGVLVNESYSLISLHSGAIDADILGRMNRTIPSTDNQGYEIDDFIPCLRPDADIFECM